LLHRDIHLLLLRLLLLELLLLLKLLLRLLLELLLRESRSLSLVAEWSAGLICLRRLNLDWERAEQTLELSLVIIEKLVGRIGSHFVDLNGVNCAVTWHVEAIEQGKEIKWLNLVLFDYINVFGVNCGQ
jgi:hypothetical protein